MQESESLPEFPPKETLEKPLKKEPLLKNELLHNNDLEKPLFKNELKTLMDLFSPEWAEQDLLSTLQDVAGDIERAISRIMEGNTDKWSHVDKKTISKKKDERGAKRGRGRGRGRGGSNMTAFPRPPKDYSSTKNSTEKHSNSYSNAQTNEKSANFNTISNEKNANSNEKSADNNELGSHSQKELKHDISSKHINVSNHEWDVSNTPQEDWGVQEKSNRSQSEKPINTEKSQNPQTFSKPNLTKPGSWAQLLKHEVSESSSSPAAVSAESQSTVSKKLASKHDSRPNHDAVLEISKLTVKDDNIQKVENTKSVSPVKKAPFTPRLPNNAANDKNLDHQKSASLVAHSQGTFSESSTISFNQQSTSQKVPNAPVMTQVKDNSAFAQPQHHLIQNHENLIYNHPSTPVNDPSSENSGGPPGLTRDEKKARKLVQSQPVIMPHQIEPVSTALRFGQFDDQALNAPAYSRPQFGMLEYQYDQQRNVPFYDVNGGRENAPVPGTPNSQQSQVNQVPGHQSPMNPMMNPGGMIHNPQLNQTNGVPPPMGQIPNQLPSQLNQGGIQNSQMNGMPPGISPGGPIMGQGAMPLPLSGIPGNSMNGVPQNPQMSQQQYPMPPYFFPYYMGQAYPMYNQSNFSNGGNKGNYNGYNAKYGHGYNDFEDDKKGQGRGNSGKYYQGGHQYQTVPANFGNYPQGQYNRGPYWNGNQQG